MKVNRPIKGYEYWDEYPDYPLVDWRYVVNNGDTRLGYWAWVREMRSMTLTKEDR